MEEELLHLSTGLGFQCQRGSSLHEKVPQQTVTWARGTGGMEGGRKGVPGSRPLVPPLPVRDHGRAARLPEPVRLTVWGVRLREGPGRGGLGDRQEKRPAATL